MPRNSLHHAGIVVTANSTATSRDQADRTEHADSTPAQVARLDWLAIAKNAAHSAIHLREPQAELEREPGEKASLRSNNRNE